MYISEHIAADKPTMNATQNSINTISRNNISSPLLKKNNLYNFIHITYDIENHLDCIIKSNHSAFNVNISFGHILFNPDTDDAGILRKTVYLSGIYVRYFEIES